MAGQLTLFGALAAGAEPLAFDARFEAMERRELTAGAWVAHQRRWLRGADALFAQLEREVPWAETTQRLYDRDVVTPRLVATSPGRGRWPLVDAMADALSERFGEVLDRVTFALYRDGRDSVAWHRDRILRTHAGDGLVISVSLGGTRPFLLRPQGGGAPSERFLLGSGDLFVMGGSCQRTWEHTVPKVRRPVDPRLVIMFRHTADA